MVFDVLEHLDHYAKGRGHLALKLDTEGAELAILQRAEDYLDRTDVVYLEYHSDDDRAAIDALLRRRGFLLYSANASTPHRGDMAYVKKRLVDSLTPYADYARSIGHSDWGGD